MRESLQRCVLLQRQHNSIYSSAAPFPFASHPPYYYSFPPVSSSLGKKKKTRNSLEVFPSLPSSSYSALVTASNLLMTLHLCRVASHIILRRLLRIFYCLHPPTAPLLPPELAPSRNNSLMRSDSVFRPILCNSFFFFNHFFGGGCNV